MRIDVEAIMSGHALAERGKLRKRRALSHSMRSRAVRGIRADREAAAESAEPPARRPEPAGRRPIAMSVPEPATYHGETPAPCHVEGAGSCGSCPDCMNVRHEPEPPAE